MVEDGVEGASGELYYTELVPGQPEVDYGGAFREDVELMYSSLLLMGEVLLPRNGGAHSLPESWEPMLQCALNLLDFGEEPLSTGDVCIHEGCLTALHTMATFVEHCATRVWGDGPAALEVIRRSADARLHARRSVEAFATALLTVFAFGAHFLDAGQCRDRNIPAMVAFLQQVVARGATGELQTDIPVQLQTALRQHSQHIWLHTMGTVQAALMVDELVDPYEP